MMEYRITCVGMALASTLVSCSRKYIILMVKWHLNMNDTGLVERVKLRRGVIGEEETGRPLYGYYNHGLVYFNIQCHTNTSC